jgi:hypothetical protein
MFKAKSMPAADEGDNAHFATFTGGMLENTPYYTQLRAVQELAHAFSAPDVAFIPERALMDHGYWSELLPIGF